MLLGCFGGLEDECGDKQMSQLLDGPAEGECMIVEIDTGSGTIGIGNECPMGACVVLMAGERFRIWKPALASEPEYMTAAVPLNLDGSCPASCE